MPVQRTDIVYVKSAVVNDTALNGGELGTVQVVDAVSANVFPVISQALRTTGHAGQWRKIFVKNKEATGLGLYNAKAYIENPTPAADMVFVCPGTLAGVQGDLGTPRLYGCGWLAAAVSAGASSMTVMVESGAVPIFAAGDMLRISDKADVDAISGNEEYVTVSTVSWAADVATVAFTPPLTNNYASTGQATRVASLIDLSTIQSAITSVVVTSTAGSYNHVQYPILPDNRGSVRQNITITFTSSTAFTIVGDTLGAMGTGNISGVNNAPNNPNAGAPYFTLNAAGFGGIFALGDTITFTITPSVKALWFKRVIPPNTPSMAGNRFVLVVEGESE